MFENTANQQSHNQQDPNFEQVNPVRQASSAADPQGEYLKKFYRISTFAVLFVLWPLFTLAFAGVHQQVLLPFSILVYSLAFVSLVLVSAFPNTETFGIGRTSQRLFLCFTLLFVYALLQSAILYFIVERPHSVLGLISGLARPLETLSGLRELLLFISLFFILRLGLNFVHSSLVFHAIAACSGMVSIIALTHWFVDNGKLFWTIAPENVFITYRARWPFVNPNHLGHFLVACFFPLLVLCLRRINSFRVELDRQINLKGLSLSTLLGRSSFQFSLLILLSLFFLCFLNLLAIAASLSRNSWAALTLGSIFFALLCSKYQLITSHFGEQLSEQINRKPNRPKRLSVNYKKQLERLLLWRKWATRIAVLAILLITIGFFSSPSGELVERRLEYGLLHTKDDIRWQMYSDSLKLWAENPVWGIGLGSWASEYNRIMNSKLSGLNPVYAHSEPIQFLVELGLVGFGLLSLSVVVLLLPLIKTFQSLTTDDKLITLGLSSAIFTLAFVSLFDFPFRIPTIYFLLALLLAKLSVVLDKAR